MAIVRSAGAAGAFGFLPPGSRAVARVRGRRRLAPAGSARFPAAASIGRVLALLLAPPGVRHEGLVPLVRPRRARLAEVRAHLQVQLAGRAPDAAGIAIVAVDGRHARRLRGRRHDECGRRSGIAPGTPRRHLKKSANFRCTGASNAVTGAGVARLNTRFGQQANSPTVRAVEFFFTRSFFPEAGVGRHDEGRASGARSGRLRGSRGTERPSRARRVRGACRSGNPSPRGSTSTSSGSVCSGHPTPSP